MNLSTETYMFLIINPLILHNNTCMYTFLGWPLGTRRPINFSLAWEGPPLPLLVFLNCLKFFVSGWDFKRFPPSCWACYWWCSCSVYVWAVLVRLHGCGLLHYQETQFHSKFPDPLVLTNVLPPSLPFLWAFELYLLLTEQKTFLLLYFHPFSLWQAAACELWQNSDSSWKGLSNAKLYLCHLLRGFPMLITWDAV